MDNLDKLIKDTLSKCSIPENTEFKINDVLNNLPKKKTKNVWLRRTVSIAACFCLMSTAIWAKNITEIFENKFAMGNGMGKAIEEGYIEMPEENVISPVIVENVETGKKIDGSNVTIKVNEFLMDDYNLSVTFDVKLPEEIRSIVKLEELWEMRFPDLLIHDENNVVLFCLDSNKSVEFLKDKNVGVNTYDDLSESMYWYNCGLNNFMEKRGTSKAKSIYNIYTSDVFPNSKKLYFNMTKIALSTSDETTYGDEEIILTGDWKLEIDVPEKFYNRPAIKYRAITKLDNYSIESLVVRKTGTEIRLKGQVDETNNPQNPFRKYVDGIELEKYSEEIRRYVSDQIFSSKEYQEYNKKMRENTRIEGFVINENGDEFKRSVSAAENGSCSVSLEGILNYRGIYDLTEYDTTEKITYKFKHLGKEYSIVLERVDE